MVLIFAAMEEGRGEAARYLSDMESAAHDMGSLAFLAEEIAEQLKIAY